eukprot:1486712-Pyramimonas_sp.AAC.1
MAQRACDLALGSSHSSAGSGQSPARPKQRRSGRTGRPAGATPASEYPSHYTSCKWMVNSTSVGSMVCQAVPTGPTVLGRARSRAALRQCR